MMIYANKTKMNDGSSVCLMFSGKEPARSAYIGYSVSVYEGFSRLRLANVTNCRDFYACK